MWQNNFGRKSHKSGNIIAICITMFYASALFIFGCSGQFRIDSIDMGSSIDRFGHIENPSLDYTFNYKGTGRFGDLYNYFYFEGDTVCFSIDFSKNISGNVKVYFIDPRTNIKVEAERTEKEKYRVWGFSLVGSLLESFNSKTLNENPNSPDRKIIQNFELYIEAEENGQVITQKMGKLFSVRY